MVMRKAKNGRILADIGRVYAASIYIYIHVFSLSLSLYIVL